MSDSAGGFHVRFWHEIRRLPWWALSLAVHSMALAALQHVAAPVARPAPEPLTLHLRRPVPAPASAELLEYEPRLREGTPSERAEEVVDGPVFEPALAEPSPWPAIGAGRFAPAPPERFSERFSGRGGATSIRIGGGAGGAFGGRGGRRGLDPDTEVIVVERASGDEGPPVFCGREVTEGALWLLDDEGREVDACPLRRTDYDAEVTGLIASVGVRQQYENPRDETLDALYVFPLPRTAAVSGFELVVGDRRIRGVVCEKEEARRLYDEARAAGYTASLLRQERPNVFVEEVANLEHGRPVVVSLRYFHHLRTADGWHELVVPTVVGPRFFPPGSGDTAAADDEALRSHPSSILPAGYRRGHDLGIRVEIDAGLPLAALESRTHDVVVRRTGAGRAVVELEDRFAIPNRDFVLRFRVAGEEPEAAVLAHRGRNGGFFSLLLAPPAGDEEAWRPRETVFVLDCSGSMFGEPLGKSKAVVRRFLESLRPFDTFRVVRFSGSADEMDPRPLVVTPENVRRALDWVDGLSSGGGTMMLTGVRAALAPPIPAGQERHVVFLTDGYIGNEDEVFAAVRGLRQDARLFSFGVGSSVNRHLLDGLAEEGRGVATYVLPEDAPEEAAEAFFRRVARPAVEDVEIDWGGIPVRDVVPARIPDLFPGVPVMLTGRYEGGGETAIIVRGRVDGRPFRRDLFVRFPEWEERNEVLGPVWARARIGELLRRAWADSDGSVRDAVTRLALDFGLVSPFTSFLAVDEVRGSTGDGTTIRIPVFRPEGVVFSGVSGSRGEWCELRMLGVKLRTTDRGLVVTDVDLWGAGLVAGVREGDLVRSLNGEVVRNGREAAAAARTRTGGLELELRRGRERLTAIFFRRE